MPRISLNGVGRLGVVQDTPADQLPPEAWTAVQNITFREGIAHKAEGPSEQFGAPSVAPHFLLPWFDGNTHYWIYGDGAQVFRVENTVHTEITRTASNYGGGARPIWTGGVLGGVPILNHDQANDPPQQWDGGTARLIDLANWPASTYARVVRPFGAYLVALNVEKSGTKYPSLVKWSHPADPGTVPVSWDETDPTRDAGESSTLSQTSDAGVDMATLGNVMLIYKENSVWAMSNYPPPYIFRIDNVTTSFGVLTQNCVQEVKGGHFVVTEDDVILHSGRRDERSLLEGRLRRWFKSVLSADFFRFTFTAKDVRRNEVWVCFVEEGNPTEYANLALVWNYQYNTWTIREIPNLSAAALGRVAVVPSNTTFDAAVGTFDENLQPFGARPIFPIERRLVLARALATSKLYDMRGEYTNDGAVATSVLERVNLAIAGQSRSGEIQVDPTVWKQVTALYPKIDTFGQDVTIRIRIGTQPFIGGPVTWRSPFDFNPRTDEYVPVNVGGYVLAVRFEDRNNTLPWALHGYDMEIIPGGLL